MILPTRFSSPAEGCGTLTTAEGKPVFGAWQKGDWSVVPFGALTGEAIGSTSTTNARAMILYLRSPIAGADQQQFTVHGQTSSVGLNISGPSAGSFRLGGRVLFNFLGDRPILNQATPFLLRAYGELQNERWRFRFGQQGDLFNPLDPTTVNFGGHKQAGNGGAFRGSLRASRFFRPAEDVVWSFDVALSQQVINDFIVDPRVVGTDNGWPNIEGRVAVGAGPARGERSASEVGVSAVIGQVRSIGLEQVVSDVWGVSLDASHSWGRFGVNAEVLTGAGLGTYNAGVGQSLNPITLDPIHTIAGWGEIWIRPIECLGLHAGFGIDDPRNEDIGQFPGPAPALLPVAGQRARNQVGWVNAIWSINEHFSVALELSHRETTYREPSTSNDGVIYHLRTRLTF